MVEIFCGSTMACISNLGAELKSFKSDGVEYIWQGDKHIWNSSAPILFPICSSLKDNEYIYEGKVYRLPKHGFASNRFFSIEHQTDSAVTFLFKSEAADKPQYPFDYELRVTYSLSKARLDIRYDVNNFSAKKMYFSIGAHEGYRLPCGLERYEIEFPQKETLYSCVLDGDTLTDERKLILENSNILPLKYDYFSDDALIFKNLKSKSAIIKTNQSKRKIKVTFDGFDYFLIWTIPKADFVCLEPWCGITDNIDHDKDIAKKEGINILEPSQVFIRSHSIEIV